MRISDWSSDVCSSDLQAGWLHAAGGGGEHERHQPEPVQGYAVRSLEGFRADHQPRLGGQPADRRPRSDRKSVVKGKSVTVRLDRGGRRIIKQKKRKTRTLKTNRTQIAIKKKYK